jgi:hypothetical protein
LTQALIDTAFHAFLPLAIAGGILLLVSLRWKGARPVSRFYGSIIVATLVAVAEMLWRPRLERQGGAQISLPQFEMEDEEWNSEDFA